MKKIISLQKLFILVFTLSICALAIAQKGERIPVTTSSKEALKLYNDAIAASEKVYLDKAFKLFEKAIETDPVFFMPHFQLAFSYLYLNDDENFKKYAGKAIALKGKLSNAEEIYKQILERFLKDKKSDVTDLGAKIIALYPKDPYAYGFQGYFYIFIGKFDESINHLKKGIELAGYKAPFYNMLAYVYLMANNVEEACKTFDKYIELEPNEANPYDSKGDYFMAVKEYQKAYDSFMKAYQLNASFTGSLKKAEQAKKMLDSGEKY